MAITPLQIGFVGTPGSDRPHLSVDGMTPEGPNLSHWPGNRTPRRYKADLSTGICLNFARTPQAERAAFLGEAELVLNDHYDTDGFLSMLTVTRPELALAREELCLAAAATGDFQTFQTRRGFMLDRIVLRLATEGSPAASEFAGLSGPAKDLARYRWLIEHAEEVLDRPEDFAGCWADELAEVEQQLDRARAGALQRELLPESGLSILSSAEPMARIVLNSLAGAYRVLHQLEGPEGCRYRYHDRTEGWFEVISVSPLPRVDLRPLAARLQRLEGEPREGARWCADPPYEPVPELWFGADQPQAYGAVTRELAPSQLAPGLVKMEFERQFGSTNLPESGT